MRIPACLLLSLLLLSPCLAQTFREDFETGTGGAYSYYKAPEDLKIERLQGQASSGQWYLRGVLPGQKKLEGFAINAAGLSGGRLATVTASVRGKGEVWLCLISSNGWLYSPTTKTLTDKWQEVSLAKALMATDKSLGIYFITRDVQPGAVFEVDDVRVTLAAPPETSDTQVGPWRLEAEDFAPNGKTVAADPQALEGSLIRSEQYVVASDLPCPRTSRPIRVACRVRSGDEKDAWRLTTSQGGNTQVVRTVKATQTTDWEWLVFDAASAGELGDRFSLCSNRGPGARGWVCLDSIVVSTTPDLSPEQLAAAPQLFGRRPLVAVGQGDVATATVIDGFVAVGAKSPAQAPTQVRVAYDDQGLRLRFGCPEPLLDTAQQRRHEFLAKVTQRDGDLYADDCVMMLLQPAGSTSVYDFSVNALGTITDACCSEPDLWASRDVTWNSQATARAQIEEKRWWVELSIPWSDLGGKPKPGDQWRVSFARSAKGRTEQSAWNLTNKGVHDPAQLGTLVFAESVPALQLQPPAALKAKGNVLPPASTDPKARILTFAEIRSAGGTRHAYGDSFDLPREADVQMAYGVLDAADLQPLYLTPVLPQGIKSSLANLILSCDGPYELFLNGQPLAQGTAASGAKIEAALEKGSNLLTLRLQKGTAALQGQIGEWRFDASDWVMAPADTPKALDPTLDDAGWARALKIGDDAQLGPVVGSKDKPTVLRCTLLYEKTRVWPTPDPVYYLAQGVTQHLAFRVEGLPGRKLDQWESFLAVPSGFEVLGSTGFYGVRPGIPRWTTTDLGEQTVLGKRMRVAKITADQPILTGRHYIMSEFQAFVRVTGAKVPADAQFVYWSRARGGSVLEAPQTIKVRVLPQVQGAQCKTLTWQLWGGWFSNMDDLAMREQVMDCARVAGFNDFVGGDRWTSDNAPRFGLRHTIGVNFESWNLNLGPYLVEHPEERLINGQGKPSGSLMCTTMLLGEGWSAVRDCLREKIETIRPSTLDYDYEYGPFAGPHSCYCDRCLKAFRDFAKLPEGQKLDADLISRQYREQWVDFMARRVAKLFGAFHRTIHELSPDSHFSVYSGYATPDNAERYGVDWRYVGEEKGCDHAGCGYGRPVEAVAATREALKGIPLVCGALLTPYERDILTPVTALTKAWLLRTVLDSTGGVLVYERTELDGRSWIAMGEATRLVAKYEDAFVHGKHLSLPGLDPAQVEALQHEGTTLVLMMNPTSKPVSLKVSLPAEWGSGEEFYSGSKVDAGATVEAQLEPGEAQALVLGR
jgi:hypothetical protein